MGHSLAALHIWRKLKLDVLHFMLSEGWFSTQTERIKWSMGSGARPVQICPAKHRAAYSCAMVDIWEWMIRMGAMTSRFEHALRPENFFRREPPWLEYEDNVDSAFRRARSPTPPMRLRTSERNQAEAPSQEPRSREEMGTCRRSCSDCSVNRREFTPAPVRHAE
ncbi:unnamed protein product [Effrenium voratum]|nr:unnamed protein product [Effrenium voratum]